MHSTKITISVADNIAAFKNAWDNFLPNGHHLCSKHLQAFENAPITDLKNHYLLVWLNKEIIGMVYLQQFQFRLSNINYTTDQTLLLKLAKAILPSKIPLLICGHLLRINFQGFYFKNPAQKSYLCDAISKFTKQSIKPYGIIIKDCEDVSIAQDAKAFGYRFFDADVTMEITRRAHWLVFDDYLKDLHKDYYKRANKIIASFEPIKTLALEASQILAQAEDIESLYWNVVNKQAFKLGTVNAAYFYELKSDLQDKFEFHAMYLNDKMVGFYTYIFYEKEMETHFIGLDYDVNKTHKLYFNILFFSLQKMISLQLDKLELGRTAREAKVNMGALPKQIINYVKIKNWVGSIIVDYVLNQFHKTTNQNNIKRAPLKNSI
jgi:hypothetical protein